jgi:two-component system chemotaxis response regulator CheY
MSYNILIVDDSKTMRNIIGRTISIAGIPTQEVLMAENGEMALQILKEKPVELIITDINMPVMDGITMIEKISEDEAIRDLPIVVISTEGSETKIGRLNGKGIKAYIRKPFSPEMIRDTLNHVLGGTS